MANMLRAFRCDLHIHTCLSPCAELELYPSALVRKAVAEKLDVIAICDHNASENCPYVMRAAAGTALTVLPGMEITSREEVHLLALFDALPPLRQLQKIIYAHLPGDNDEQRFGCQAIVNDRDEVEGFNPRLLIGATELALDDLLLRIHALGGIAIASHIDRESFSVISQLGDVGPDMPFDALEISTMLGLAGARKRYPTQMHYPFVTSSDAHRIADIGKGVTEFILKIPVVEELQWAFAGQKGRRIAGC
ncbi:MAG: histidinol-phosphatase [Deltaproteobacteria bacterium]|nr:histidinol-phosphatase [Deltaproteobacteria bacterium]